MKKIVFPLLCAVIFFVTGFLTLKDYGTSWDETLHFSRGQVFLNYFLTGSKNYSNQGPYKSYYQLDYQAGDFFFNDAGHPPLNGILAAILNKIFYQKLHLVGDIYSYQLFNLLVSSITIFVVVFLTLSVLGFFPALIAFLGLFSYPLFFSESHFNVKDPAEAAFISLTFLFFYLYSKKPKLLWIILFFVSFGLGLGTKFNILFTPIIIIFYLLFYLRKKLSLIPKLIYKLPKTHLVFIILGPILSFAILFLSWPYLWNDFPNSILNIIHFYQQIGTGAKYQSDAFYFFNFNFFPSLWILFTTPPILLALTLIGIFSAILNKNKQKSIFILWLLWLIVPIARVTLPGFSIYGGIRQIFEFLPAMVMLAALGVWQIQSLVSKFKSKRLNILVMILVLTLFIWPFFVLAKIHPNQNVYFNFLIGGLAGAKEKNFPSWGNSYGNAYFQGITWINQNLPPNSKVALIQGTESNTPTILYRSDISLKNSYWSGLNRKGEYLMDLTFNDTGVAFHYTWEYVEKFLEPVYEVKVDGVSILKIWKNDLAHTKNQFKLKEVKYEKPAKVLVFTNTLKINLDEKVTLSRVEVDFENNSKCSEVRNGLVETSIDQINWVREQDTIPFPQVGNKSNLVKNKFNVYFAAKLAKYLRFSFDNSNSCALSNPRVNIYTLRAIDDIKQ